MSLARSVSLTLRSGLPAEIRSAAAESSTALRTVHRRTAVWPSILNESEISGDGRCATGDGQNVGRTGNEREKKLVDGRRLELPTSASGTTLARPQHSPNASSHNRATRAARTRCRYRHDRRVVNALATLPRARQPDDFPGLLVRLLPLKRLRRDVEGVMTVVAPVAVQVIPLHGDFTHVKGTTFGTDATDEHREPTFNLWGTEGTTVSRTALSKCTVDDSSRT